MFVSYHIPRRGIWGRSSKKKQNFFNHQNFLLISKDVSFRQTIYVFDSKTKEKLTVFFGISKALKYAKVNFYTLKSLIEKGNSYNGKIYSYKDKI